MQQLEHCQQQAAILQSQTQQGSQQALAELLHAQQQHHDEVQLTPPSWSQGSRFGACSSNLLSTLGVAGYCLQVGLACMMQQPQLI